MYDENWTDGKNRTFTNNAWIDLATLCIISINIVPPIKKWHKTLTWKLENISGCYVSKKETNETEL